MRPTKVLQGKKAQETILKGVNAVYEPVRRTLGPQGKNALLFRSFNRGSRITNDGYTVAQAIEPKDYCVRLVSTAFKEACKRTNEKVGDGTTGTTVIAGTLANDAFRLLSEGQSETLKTGSIGVMELKEKILAGAEKVKEEIKKSAQVVKTLEELEKIATISVEDEELGKIIAKMAWELGVDSFIDVVEGYKGEIETESVVGMRFPAKIPSKVFINNPAKYEAIATDANVWITNYALDSIRDTSAIGSNLLKKGVTKLIIIAPSFSDAVLMDWVNVNKQGIFFLPIAVPSLRTEQFEDIAIYCGANFIDKNKAKDVKNVDISDLGFLEKLIVKDSDAKEDASALGGKGTQEIIVSYFEEEEIEVKKGEKLEKKKVKVQKQRTTTPVKERIEVLKGQLKEITTGEQFKKLLERRIASLASAGGVIKVGDTTEASSLYRKLKIEDCVYACKAALRGGFVKGGGLCLKEIADKLPDDDILKNALLAPYQQIQSSVSGGMEIGENILDPMEAIYYAVEHATQVVANLATVDIIIQEMEDPIMGEGEEKIAKAINEMVITQRLKEGQLTQNQAEMERDMLNGLTVDEYNLFDRG